MNKNQSEKYIAAEVYRDLVEVRIHEITWWRRLSIALTVGISISMFFVYQMAKREAIMPYVVPISGLHMDDTADFVLLKPSISINQQKIISHEFIRKYITDLRTISRDYDTTKSRITWIKSVTSSDLLESFVLPLLREQNPYEMSSGLSRKVEVESILPQQGNEWSVRWLEIARDSKSGKILYTNSFAASLSLTVNPPKKMDEVSPGNPLGIIVHNVHHEQIN